MRKTTVSTAVFTAILAMGVMLIVSVAAGAWEAGTFRDDAGKTVFLEKKPVRIIALAPSVTEILFALGAGDRVVGVSAYSDYPAEAKEKPVVGDAMQLNLEKLLSLQPDLVVADGNLGAKYLEAMGELGLKVFVTAPKTYAEVAESIRTLGKLVGEEEAAARQAATMLAVRDEVRAKVQGQQAPKVFFEIWSEPLMTAGPGSFIDELINDAGGKNIAFDATSPWPMFSLETVVERDPDVIILTSVNKEAITGKPAWQCTAVKTGRVNKVVPDTLVRTTGRLADGLKMLAQILHPELSW